MAKAPNSIEDCRNIPEDQDEELDWEQMEDSGLLDKKLQAIEHRLVTKTTQATGFVSNIDTPFCIMTPGPQIKILKRPTSSQDNASNTSAQLKPQQPMKTLQQREAEYAQARLRILGEAAAPATSPNNVTLSPMANLANNRAAGPEMRVNNGSVNVVRYPRGPDGSHGFRPRT